MGVNRRGFSLLEILLVLSVLGLLLLAAPRLNPDRTAVDQAARILSESLVRARLEAIRNNSFAGLYLDPGGRYFVFLDTDESRSFTPQDRVLQEVRLGEGEWARVRLVLNEPALLLFDPRGIPQDFGGLSVEFTNQGGTYTKRVEISPQGRAKTL